VLPWIAWQTKYVVCDEMRLFRSCGMFSFKPKQTPRHKLIFYFILQAAHCFMFHFLKNENELWVSEHCTTRTHIQQMNMRWTPLNESSSVTPVSDVISTSITHLYHMQGNKPGWKKLLNFKIFCCFPVLCRYLHCELRWTQLSCCKWICFLPTWDI